MRREGLTPPFSFAAGDGTCFEKLLLLTYPLLLELENVERSSYSSLMRCCRSWNMCREAPTPHLSSAAEAEAYVEKLLLLLYPLLQELEHV